jgi:hypothetical protein
MHAHTPIEYAFTCIVNRARLLSRPDLSSFYMSLFYFGQGVSWGGHSMFCFLFLCVWPGMVPNQRQLAIVVSD